MQLRRRRCNEPIVDPFCGVGTVLAVANAFGLDAVGVERSTKRSAQARLLRLARSECENAIKADTQATVRNIPFGSERVAGTCIKCGRPSSVEAWFAKSY